MDEQTFVFRDSEVPNNRIHALLGNSTVYYFLGKISIQQLFRLHVYSFSTFAMKCMWNKFW